MLSIKSYIYIYKSSISGGSISLCLSALRGLPALCWAQIVLGLQTQEVLCNALQADLDQTSGPYLHLEIKGRDYWVIIGGLYSDHHHLGTSVSSPGFSDWDC